ncbi:hypothetical protein DFJ74DRAFT_687863 [Hyaloraphidium curvatum]|nr:hypothetical protein DFJ74DRAFT_687863 [Hyaloraphidium curvatum]
MAVAAARRTDARLGAGVPQEPAKASFPGAGFLADERAALVQKLVECASSGIVGETLHPTVVPLPPFLFPSGSPNALVWHVPASVDHWLRRVAGPGSFFVATAVPPKKMPAGLVSRKKKATEEDPLLVEHTAVLTRRESTDVDATTRNDSRGAGGLVGGPGHEQPEAAPTYLFPMVPATHTPLPMQAARHLLAVFSSAAQSDPGFTALPRMFAYATLSSGERNFVGVQGLGDGLMAKPDELAIQRRMVVYDIADQAPLTAKFPDVRPAFKAGEKPPAIELEGSSDSIMDVNKFLLDFTLDLDEALPEDADAELPSCEVKIRFDIVHGIGFSSLPSNEATPAPVTSSHLALHLDYNPSTATALPPTPLALPLSDPAGAVLEIGYVPWPRDRISHLATARTWREWRILSQWCAQADSGEEEGEAWKISRPVEGRAAAENVDKWIEALENEGGSSATASAYDLDEEFAAAVLDNDDESADQDGEDGLKVPPLPTPSASVSGTHSAGRKDLDFTERMWNFLLSAQSKMDLVDAVTAIVDALETGKLLPPVGKHNPTPIAKLVRDCIRLHSLRTAASSQTDSLQSYIESGFDAVLEQLWANVCMLGIWKVGRDARALLSGIVETDVLDLLLVNPVTRVPYGCTPDAAPALSEEDLENMNTDPAVHEIRWAVRALEGLWRGLELFRFVAENAIGVPHGPVKRVVAAMLSDLVAEAQVRAQIILQRERGISTGARNPAPMDSVRTGQGAIAYRVGLPRVSVATSRFIGHVAKSFKPSEWTLKVRSEDAAGFPERHLILTQRRDASVAAGLFAEPTEPIAAPEQELDDVHDLTIGPGAGLLAGRQDAGGLAFAVGDDEDRTVYDAAVSVARRI